MTESRKDEQKSLARAGHDASTSSNLPSSTGDSPKEVTPKDISPKDASWADRSARNISSRDQDEHDEALLDEAVDQTFPASDPLAELPATHGYTPYVHGADEEEDSLDEAIEMTFPASDPIAIPSSEELTHEKMLRNSQPPRPATQSR